LKSLFKILITAFLVKRVGVRQELSRFTVDYLHNILLVKAGAQRDLYKSVAFF